MTVALTATCQGQSTQEAKDAGLDRRVENLVRSQFNVPADYGVALGPRSPSTTAGFANLPVTLSHEGKVQVVDFLISTNGKTLARLETFDLDKDPFHSIDIGGRPIRGNSDAPVTVINFDDLECPVCSRVHQLLFPAALDRYKGKIRFIYKDNPLLELHPWAMHAAVNGNCLAAQSGEVYWTYVDYLHSHGEEVSGADRNPQRSFAVLDRLARMEANDAKLDVPKLEMCLAKQDETVVHASMKEAAAMGLNFTPAIFVNGERIAGYIPAEQVWQVIERALKDAGVPQSTVPDKGVLTGAQGH